MAIKAHKSVVNPKVSVVILVHNRTDVFKRCLDSLLSQNYNKVEIIVVDNNSINRTKDLLSNYSDNLTVITLDQDHGACMPRNLAANKASGEYILFLDSDAVLVEKDTISNAVKVLNKHSNLAAIGGVAFSDEKLKILQHAQLKFKSPFEIDEDSKMSIPKTLCLDIDYIQTDFMMIRQKIFREVGGFDHFFRYYPEDVDISFRVLQMGYEIALSPKIKYWHQYRPRAVAIDHGYFLKVCYMYMKNLSLVQVFHYYFNFLKKGFLKALGANNKVKKIYYLTWYLVSPLFLIWLIALWPLVKMRKLISFTKQVETESFFSKISDRLIKLPLFLELGCFNKLSAFLFFLKKNRQKRGLYVFITNRCMYTCQHCFLGDDVTKKRPLLSVEEIKKAYLSYAFNIGGVSLTGGEPFMRPDIVELCNVFQEDRPVKSIAINTNGWNPDYIENKVREILSNAPRSQSIKMTISLDGLEETHDFIRERKGAFKNAVTSIRKLKALSINDKRLTINAQVTFVQFNKKEFYKLYNFVKNDLGVKLSFNWYRDGRAFGVDKNLIFSPDNREDPIHADVKLPNMSECEELFEFFEEERWYDRRFRLINKYTLDILKKGRAPFSCAAPKLNMVMFADGGVSFCELVKPFANLRDFDFNLKEVVESQIMKQMTNSVKNCSCIHPCVLPVSMQEKHFADLKLDRLRSFQST